MTDSIKLLGTPPEGYPSEPEHLLKHFLNISCIPRPSGQEQALKTHIMMLAQEHNCEYQTDEAGNLVVRVPASVGMEHKSSIAIQNHLDMVTVKHQNYDHDFLQDPLTLEIDQGWLTAKNTTLGADNGIGCAAALGLMTDPSVQHPMLELVFTVEEETGLYGASGFDAELIHSDLLLNLDTEDWGELFIGCAGGKGWQFTSEIATEFVASDRTVIQLNLKKLSGGHSGIQIHEQLGNSIKLLARLVKSSKHLETRICEFKSGIAHNVIPREGSLILSIPKENEPEFQKLVHQEIQNWKTFLPQRDQQLEIEITESAGRSQLTQEAHNRVIALVLNLPHGAHSYNPAQPADLVNLSSNLARVSLENNELFLETSIRFFNQLEAVHLEQQILSLIGSFGMSAKEILSYPSWQPDFESSLLKKAKVIYQDIFDHSPSVKAIHAGLECGIIKSKKSSIDVISFGPTIKGAHSPSERLELKTLIPFWEYLKKMVQAI